MKTRSCTLRETGINSISASQTNFLKAKKRASKGIMRRENNHVKTRTKMKANDESAIAIETEQELDTKVPPQNDTPIENKKVRETYYTYSIDKTSLCHFCNRQVCVFDMR